MPAPVLVRETGALEAATLATVLLVSAPTDLNPITVTDTRADGEYCVECAPDRFLRRGLARQRGQRDVARLGGGRPQIQRGLEFISHALDAGPDVNAM